MPPKVTGNLLVDIDGDGSFAEDLCAADGDFTSGFWKIEDGFSLSGRGRVGGENPMDAADMAEVKILLDNSDGRFSAANNLSPYASGFVNRFRPYIQAHAKATFNAVTYDLIKGVITDIKISPEATDQLCEITIRDYMYVLSRTEIRRPIMLNQYTGVITHRLLDDVEGAEDREACGNPAFAQNTTGWTTFGTATLTRVTGDDKILEGPGSGKVVTTAVNSGIRYTMTGLNGDKYRLSCYVKREAAAGIVRIRMADTVGTVANGTLTALEESNYWVRLDVTGTYNAGSTSQYIEIESSTTTTFRVGAVHAIPFAPYAFDRNVDDGQSRLEKYTYPPGPALTAIQKVRENELGALAYFAGDGTFHFEDRHHRWRESHSLTSQATFNERGVIDHQESADDRIKSVKLDYPHYVDGAPGTVVWESDRFIPLPIGFRWPVDADYEGGLVRDSITPVANTDYFINSAGDGSGADMTGSVTFTFDDFGGGSVGYFTNNATNVVYLRSYRVRGTPARLAADSSPARYTATGVPSLAAPFTFSYDLNASEPDVQAWAEYLGIRYSTQRARIGLRLAPPFPDLTLSTAAQQSDMTQILARTISDRVTITNNDLPFSTYVSAAFYIDGIDLRCTGHSLEATWRVSPVDIDYGIWGTSTWDNAVFAP